MELFLIMTGTRMLHVPYKGAAAVFTDLVGKRVDMFFGDLPGVQSLIQAEKLKVLGIIGNQRSTLLPGVRTLAEQGITGVIPTGWYGMVMAASADDAVIQTMSDALGKSLKDPKVVSQRELMGAMPMYQATGDFKEFLSKDAGRWDALIKRRNLKLEN
jgi:tripartite-type tricarboxylate transporter receptor subunit TctC